MNSYNIFGALKIHCSDCKGLKIYGWPIIFAHILGLNEFGCLMFVMLVVYSDCVQQAEKLFDFGASQTRNRPMIYHLNYKVKSGPVLEC